MKEYAVVSNLAVSKVVVSKVRSLWVFSDRQKGLLCSEPWPGGSLGEDVPEYQHCR